MTDNRKKTLDGAPFYHTGRGMVSRSSFMILDLLRLLKGKIQNSSHKKSTKRNLQEEIKGKKSKFKGWINWHCDTEGILR